MKMQIKNPAAKNDVSVDVEFKHFRRKTENYTLCRIMKGDNVIRVEKAYCSANDNFNKAIGRKIALKRCIDHLSKEMRTQIWKQYFKYCPNDK